MLFAFTSVLLVSTLSWIGDSNVDGRVPVAASPCLRSAGPLAFGEDGVLFIGDTIGAAIYAVDTADMKRMESGVTHGDVEIDEKVGALFNVPTKNILINDLIVNPRSGNVYVSASILRQKQIAPAVVRVAPSGAITTIPLAKAVFLRSTRQKPGSGREPGDIGIAYATNNFRHIALP